MEESIQFAIWLRNNTSCDVVDAYEYNYCIYYIDDIGDMRQLYEIYIKEKWRK